MLQPISSESKQRSSPARTMVRSPLEHQLHLRSGGVAGLQRAVGNQALMRMLASSGNGASEGLRIQPKLTVGAIDDPLEREADEVADRVMRMPNPEMTTLPRKCDCGGTCSKCQGEALRMRKASPAAETGVPAPPSVHEVLRATGRPLDAATRAFFEPRFGHDFRHVLVHSGWAAEQSAQDVSARAYTVGQHIVFGRGRFAPETKEGRDLLAHELAHTVQRPQATGKGLHAGAHGALLRKNAPKPASDESLQAPIEGRAKGLYETFLSPPFQTLEVEALADHLVEILIKHVSPSGAGDATQPYMLVQKVFELIPDRLEDNVAVHLMELLPARLLRAIANNADGDAMLNVFIDALMTGDVSEEERKQNDRIIAAKREAKRVREAKAAAQGKVPSNTLAALTHPKIFPIKQQKFMGHESAELTASLLPNGRVSVSYPAWDKLTPSQRRILTSTTHFSLPQLGKGIELDPNEIVVVKDDDRGGEFRPLLAIELIDITNQSLEAFAGRVKKTAVLAATFGSGALAGTGLLARADQLAFVVQSLSIVADDYREEIAKMPGGERFLEALDTANIIVDYYGWTRLGIDGLKVIKNQLRPAFTSWRQKVSGKLRNSNAFKVTEKSTETFLHGIDSIDYVNVHPEKIHDGAPGRREAETLGGHRIVEVHDANMPTGIGCELHSQFAEIPCPNMMGGAEKPGIGKAPFDEPLTASERRLTPDQLRQKHILELQASKQREFRGGSKREAATGHGRAEVKRPGKSVPSRLERGQLAHQYAELLIPVQDLPRGLRAEVTVELPGGSVRLDRVDFESGVYYEIKPNTEFSRTAGEEQIRKYEEYMNRNHPLPGGRRWTGRVVTYEHADAIGMFGI